MKSIRNVCCALAIALGMLAIPSSAGAAASVAVDTSGDGSTGCTLRAAIESADTNSDQQGCHFSQGGPGSFDHQVRIPSSVSSPIVLSSSIDVSDYLLQIVGPGADRLTVSGPTLPPYSRVFNIDSGALVWIDGMTITGGTDFPDTGQAAGGGINVAANAFLLLNGVAVTGNLAISNLASSGTEAKGGGIYVGPSGGLNVANSTVSANVAFVNQTGTCQPGGAGGGIFADQGSSLEIFNSTVAGNQGGGGIEFRGTGFLESDTVRYNARCPVAGATGGSNVTMTTGVGVDVRNTLVTDPIRSSVVGTLPNCVVPESFISDGFNLEDGNSCGFDKRTDQVNVTNPGLAVSLANNGGPTETYALLPGSPAIDRGKSFSMYPDLQHDQRGLPRPVDFPDLVNWPAGFFPGTDNPGDGSDIGAFEVQQSCPGQPTPGAPCAAAPTGQRAAKIKKCKKKLPKGPKRQKCIKKAKKLPV